MRLLIDTHALHWYIEGDERLSPHALALIRNSSNEILVSPACFWEIAIKVDLGKWQLNRSYPELMALAFETYGFKILPILPDHAAKLIGMDYPQGHRDPFDRLLVAQCLAEKLPLVSCDQIFDAYGVNRWW